MEAFVRAWTDPQLALCHFVPSSLPSLRSGAAIGIDPHCSARRLAPPRHGWRVAAAAAAVERAVHRLEAEHDAGLQRASVLRLASRALPQVRNDAHRRHLCVLHALHNFRVIQGLKRSQRPRDRAVGICLVSVARARISGGGAGECVLVPRRRALGAVRALVAAKHRGEGLELLLLGAHPSLALNARAIVSATLRQRFFGALNHLQGFIHRAQRVVQIALRRERSAEDSKRSN